MTTSDGPTLVLSDIMHIPSPSPGPQGPLPTNLDQHPLQINGPAEQVQQQNYTQETLPVIQRPDSPDQDPPGPTELQSMRTRLQQLGLLRKNAGDTNSRTPLENEIIDMVIRLTSHVPIYPDPVQLSSQAETIAELTQQRNLLLREKEEQHKRWAAERDGWDRMAEALIAKRRAAVEAAGLDDETTRYISRLEDANKFLKQRLTDTQERISTLEHELTNLRPILYMPNIDGDLAFTFPPLVSQPKQIPAPRHRKTKKEREKEKEEEAIKAAEEDVEMINANSQEVDVGEVEASTSTTQSQTQVGPQQTSGSQPQSQSHYRTPQELEAALALPVPPRKVGKKGKAPATSSTGGITSHAHATNITASKPDPNATLMPKFSDARFECLLTVARKVGKIRAGQKAGLIKERDKDKEKERESEGVRRRARERKEKQRERDRERKDTGEGEAEVDPVAGPSTTRFSHSKTAPPRTPPKRSATIHHPITGHPIPPPYLHPSMTQPPPPHPQMAGQPQMVYYHPAAVQAAHGNAAGAVPMYMSLAPWPAIPPGAPMPPNTIPSPAAQRQSQPQKGKATPVARVSTPRASRTPARKGSQTEVDNPRSSRSQNQSQTQTRAQRKDVQTQPQSQPTEGPSTPFGSLLSAARSLMVDEDYDGDADAGHNGIEVSVDEPPEREVEERRTSPRKRRKRGTADAPVTSSSPIKRRKLAPTPTLHTISPSTPDKTAPVISTTLRPVAPVSVARERSALDVLADQAASAQAQQHRSSVDPGSQRVTPEDEGRMATQHTQPLNGTAMYHPTPEKGKGKVPAQQSAGPSSLPDIFMHTSSRPRSSSAASASSHHSSHPIVNMIVEEARPPPDNDYARHSVGFKDWRPISAPPGPKPQPPIRSGLPARRGSAQLPTSTEGDTQYSNGLQPWGVTRLDPKNPKSTAVRASTEEPSTSRIQIVSNGIREVGAEDEDDDPHEDDTGRTVIPRHKSSRPSRSRSRRRLVVTQLPDLGSPRKISVVPAVKSASVSEDSLDADAEGEEASISQPVEGVDEPPDPGSSGEEEIGS